MSPDLGASLRFIQVLDACAFRHKWNDDFLKRRRRLLGLHLLQFSVVKRDLI